MSFPIRSPAEILADMRAARAELGPVPKRLLLAPRLFESLRREEGAAPGTHFDMAGLEVQQSDGVSTWAIEMTDGTLQLPEGDG